MTATTNSAATKSAATKSATMKSAATKSAKAKSPRVKSDAIRSPGRLYNVLIAPIVSEKTTMIADKHNQVAFKVVQDATRREVKQAVEALFKVEVDSVQILNRRGKEKRFGRTPGKRSNLRKAYVCLKAGQEINFAEEVK
jgi:large subunit ribosomal protein L23